MATLCRSSQPLVGLKLLHKSSSGQWGSQCEDDVVLLEHLHAASGHTPTGPPPPPAVLRRRHSEDLRRKAHKSTSRHRQTETDMYIC
jgi:hypothetical protein